MVILTLIVFGLVIAVITLGLRQEVRTQILHRESEALYSATMLQRDLLQETESALPLDQGDIDLFAIVLRTSQMRGVVAVRMFDPDGTFFDSVPIEVTDDDLPVEAVIRAENEGPIAVFHESFALDRLFLETEGVIQGEAASIVPLLEVLIPLNRGDDPMRSGLAQYWIDGSSVQAEFDRLDRSLAQQAGFAFAAGALLSLLGLGFAFARLEKANRMLRARTSELARANVDLSMAAKTNAIGAVTSHLIHGLKNPLAGLESLVVPSEEGTGATVSEDGLREAAAAARRLRQMIDEVVMIIREEESSARYEFPVNEVLELVAHRVEAKALEKGVRFAHRGGAKGTLSNREANLVGLILVNLIDNAIEASPDGGTVSVEAMVYDREIEFLVEDQGPGLPESVRANLFQPVRSTKEGGTGIGLALCHQLATSLGGHLALEDPSGDTGTRFKLVVPATVLVA